MIFAPLASLAGIAGVTAMMVFLGPQLGIASLRAVLTGGFIALISSIGGFAVLGLRHVRRIERLSSIDSLTSLPNRRALHRDR